MGDAIVNPLAREMKAALALAASCLLGGCAVLESKGAVVSCQAADTATTMHAVSVGAREANPVVAWLLKEFGPRGFIAAKMGVTLLVLHYHPELPSGLLSLANGVTCAVAAHNAKVAAELEAKHGFPVTGHGLRWRASQP